MLAATDATERLYAIAAGGSSPLGNLGYLNAALELEQQVRAGVLPAPHRLYLAMGTMGCAVGLALGLALTELPTHLIAVRVSNVPTSTPARFQALFDSTVAWLRQRDPAFPQLALDPSRVSLEGRFLGRGYAQPTRAGRDAVRLAREHAGLTLELTYTAKALAAVAAVAPSIREERVLFWNTHSRVEPATGDTGPRDLPREFRPYFLGNAARR